MPFPRNSLRAFLSHAKASYHLAVTKKQKVTLVVGNESADLDSLTSSILYAYIRSIFPPHSQYTFTPLYIPLLNIPTSDISLRPEFATLFRRTNVSASDLLTLDDLPPPSTNGLSLPAENTRWILVDHNKLQSSLGLHYSSRVHGVIDHHEEEHAVPMDTDPEPRIIEKCGSCTSLVVRQFQQIWDLVSRTSVSSAAANSQGDSIVDDSAVIEVWDAQVAKFALASILIDTRNLTAVGKVEQADRDAVDYLEAKIRTSSREDRPWNRATFFEEIDGAKSDIEGLSLYDILRKDYKEWSENGLKLGVSSVVKPLAFLANKAHDERPMSRKEKAIDEAVQDFADRKCLSIFAIMTTSVSPDGNFWRELLLESRQDHSDVVARFEMIAQDKLALEELQLEAISNRQEPASTKRAKSRKTWLQKDDSKSRKQVAPLLRKAMQ